MWRIEYYTENSGRQPVADWVDNLDKKVNAYLKDRIIRLQQHGLILLDTNMMRPLKGCGGDFYEIKYNKYRIALFHDTIINTFVLLHGFKKERMRETKEIETACSRLREYKSRR
jgi:phage-related protein